LGGGVKQNGKLNEKLLKDDFLQELEVGCGDVKIYTLLVVLFSC
jgi:hypothetical protein